MKRNVSFTSYLDRFKNIAKQGVVFNLILFVGSFIVSFMATRNVNGWDWAYSNYAISLFLMSMFFLSIKRLRKINSLYPEINAYDEAFNDYGCRF